MKTATLTLQFHSWWHAGSGHGRGGEADELVIRDVDNVPYLPGKTLKGLLRDAVQLAEDFNRVAPDTTDTLFGKADPSTLRGKKSIGLPDDAGNHESEKPGRLPGGLQVTNAVLSEELSLWLKAGGATARSDAFREILSFTAIDLNGLAKDKSLRMIEVMPPLMLTAEVTGPDNDGWIGTLQKCQGLIRAAGKHRHRGLGRCTVTITEANANEPACTPPSASAAVSVHGCVWLRIELESDVIVSQSAATSGGHDSLDYLPGSVLLGAAAKSLFQTNGFSPDVFLSGKVRFGDGLPVAKDGKICLPVPLNIHFFKQVGLEGEPINGLKGLDAEVEKHTRPEKQTQQARKGYLAFSKTEVVKFEMGGSYLLKTARDRTAFGTAKERQLFEYDTLPKGQVFFAPIRWDESAPDMTEKVNQIIKVLTQPGVRLGRSRSAEFGQVKITFAGDPEVKDIESILHKTKGEGVCESGTSPDFVHLYLLSDIALSDDAAPRLRPTAADFGFDRKTWEFVAKRSFIRSRRYSPWNAFHHARLTERQVLARGSVITLQRTPANGTNEGGLPKDFVNGIGSFGLYTHEGLGCVLLNPDFVLQLPFINKSDPNSKVPVKAANPPDLLANWVSHRERNLEIHHRALKTGGNLAAGWFELHLKAMKQRRGFSGKSQWSQVRQMAVAARGDKDRLQKSLAEFCPRGLRKQYWDCGKPSLWEEIKNELNKEPDGMLACAMIAAAAEKIISDLQKQKGSRHHDQNGGQS